MRQDHRLVDGRFGGKSAPAENERIDLNDMRALKKGAYVLDSLIRKIEKMNNAAYKEVIKTDSRDSTVLPVMVGHTIGVHNGRKYIPVLIVEQMIGHKLGEFSKTRTFRGHAGQQEVKKRGPVRR